MDKQQLEAAAQKAGLVLSRIGELAGDFHAREHLESAIGHLPPGQARHLATEAFNSLHQIVHSTIAQDVFAAWKEHVAESDTEAEAPKPKAKK